MCILAEFQHIPQTDQVMLEQPAAAEAALNAGEDAGLSGGFDHPVGGGQRFQVAGLPEVAVENRDAQAPQPQPVALRAGAHQIIDARDGKAPVAARAGSPPQRCRRNPQMPVIRSRIRLPR